MERYWQIEYRQDLLEAGRPPRPVTGWGRPAVRFPTLEDLVSWLREGLCPGGRLSVDPATGELRGESDWGGGGKVATAARAVYVEEDLASPGDFAQLGLLPGEDGK